LSYTIFERGPYSYLYKDSNNVKLHILGSFLKSEIMCERRYEYLIDWLLNKPNIFSAQSWIHWDAYGIEKINNNNIHVYFQYDLSKDNYNYFETTKEKMIAILDRWKEIASQIKPHGILITQENDDADVQIEPLYSHEEVQEALKKYKNETDLE
jgi:hypothetical protein